MKKLGPHTTSLVLSWDVGITASFQGLVRRFHQCREVFCEMDWHDMRFVFEATVASMEHGVMDGMVYLIEKR